MKLKTIKKAIEKVKELPTLPAVANKVNMLLADPKSSTADLAEVIELDQSITAKILKLVNSAYYSLSERVSSIHQAIALLGHKNISNIVLTLSVFDTLKHSKKSSFDRRGFWIHSIATAIISERIAKESMYRATDDIFTAGLLHDLGKVFMDGYLHEEFEKALEAAAQSGSSFFEAEHSLFDVDHAMLGEWIARTWKLPINVVAVIKHHHHELSQREGLAVSSDITVDIVRLSDILVRKGGYGENGDARQYVPQLLEDLFKRLPLSENDTGKILKSLKTKLHSSETLLNFATGG